MKQIAKALPAWAVRAGALFKAISSGLRLARLDEGATTGADMMWFDGKLARGDGNVHCYVRSEDTDEY
jgi:hypothetical protein